MLLVVPGLEGLWVKAVELESSVPGWWMAGSGVGKMALRQCVCVCVQTCKHAGAKDFTGL